MLLQLNPVNHICKQVKKSSERGSLTSLNPEALQTVPSSWPVASNSNTITGLQGEAPDCRKGPQFYWLLHSTNKMLSKTNRTVVQISDAEICPCLTGDYPQYLFRTILSHQKKPRLLEQIKLYSISSFHIILKDRALRVLRAHHAVSEPLRQLHQVIMPSFYLDITVNQ